MKTNIEIYFFNLRKHFKKSNSNLIIYCLKVIEGSWNVKEIKFKQKNLYFNLSMWVQTQRKVKTEVKGGA